MDSRIEKVQKRLAKEGWDALIVDNPIDLYYLTGLTVSLGRLVVDTKTATLFVDGRYFEAAKKTVSIPVVLTKGFGIESSFDRTFSFKQLSVAFDSAFTTYQSFQTLENLNNGRGKLIAVEHPILYIREIKEEKEITLLKEAAQLCSEGFQKILTSLKEGDSEEKVALDLEMYWRRNGGEGLAFDSIVAFQENASQPHYRAGKQKLKKGNIIQFDVGVFKSHYASDMSRVVAFGKPDPLWNQIYKIVREAQFAAIALCKPGVLIKDIDLAARKVIEEAGYGENFTHGLGHGVGLEVHELPVIKNLSPFGERVLKEGMVITIEPGIYLPNRGGIRLEDVIVITAKGHQNLTALPLPNEIPIV